MKMIKHYLFSILASALLLTSQAQPGMDTGSVYNEPYRPQIHFSPRAHWMNDPNGMVYSNGTYHLFFQYYPDGVVWGPMHWGHATSTNMMHWKEQPIAIYPDSLGYIFSGSAVVDSFNTSGLGKEGKAPLVAIFTHHDPVGEKNKSITYQNQSIAYSNDDGKTWTKYAGNPVLKNPGITDFRDPKVSWYAPEKKWIMTLATKDRITFFSSKNLKDWKKESEFGETVGAHGGVWECPDLFQLSYGKEKIWILFVSINPGGPNGGSATQYFTGKFDGSKFTPFQTDTRWIDWGTDNYAGVTWSNTGNRKIFLGWMSNWQYANRVPTAPWRSAMTIPRDLSLQKIGEKYYILSQPSPEVLSVAAKPVKKTNINAANYDVDAQMGKLSGPAYFQFNTKNLQSFSFTLMNKKGEQVVFGYDKGSNQYFIDRTKGGKTDFEEGFAARHTAPRLTKTAPSAITIVVDKASIEVFADNGLTTMTSIFFPTEPFTDVQLQSSAGMRLQTLQYRKMESTWKK